MVAPRSRSAPAESGPWSASLRSREAPRTGRTCDSLILHVWSRDAQGSRGRRHWWRHRHRSRRREAPRCARRAHRHRQQELGEPRGGIGRAPSCRPRSADGPDRRAQPRAGRRARRAHGQAFRAHRHPRQQRRGQLHLPRRGSLDQRMERGRRHRAERHVLLLARRRPADDPSGTGRLDRLDPGELRVDGQRRHRPLRRGEGGRDVADADARRRMGAPPDPRQRGCARADRIAGRRETALGFARGCRTHHRSRAAEAVGQARGGGRRGRVPRLRARRLHHRRGAHRRRRGVARRSPFQFLRPQAE